MQRFFVPCECGHGYKQFLKASERARNPGRYYYRCPHGNSTCTFIWADELLSQRYAQLHPYISPYASPQQNITNDQGIGLGIRERYKGSIQGSLNLSTPGMGIDSEEVSSTFKSCTGSEIPLRSGANGNFASLALISCCLGCVAFALSFLLILVCFFIVLK